MSKKNEYQADDDGRIATGAAAKIMGVKRITIRRWVREGFLKGFETPMGQIRVRLSDVLAMAGKSAKKA